MTFLQKTVIVIDGHIADPVLIGMDDYFPPGINEIDIHPLLLIGVQDFGNLIITDQ